LASTRDEEFTQYVAGSWGLLRSRAFRLCHDWDDAADLVQTTLAHAYERWALLEHVAQRDAYLATMMARLHFRERRKPRWTAEVLLSEIPDSTSTRLLAEVVTDRLLFTAALAQLGPRQRAVVALHIMDDLQAEKVAEILDCRPSTVRSQTARALARLRDILAEYGEASRGEDRPT
jgi:RNA polymerase sigma factor (sigma-70 family)